MSTSSSSPSTTTKFVGFAAGAAAAAVSCASTPASAALIASDSFQVGGGGYTSGQIVGQGAAVTAGATGFTGNWAGSAIFNATAVASLSFGTYAGLDSGGVSYTGTSALREVTRPLSVGVASGAANVTVWSAALFRIADTDGTNRGVIAVGGATNGSATTPIANSVLSFGVENGVAGVLPGGGSSAALVQLKTTGGATVNMADSAPHLVVVKIERNVSGPLDRATAWVDPTDLTSEAQLNATASGSTSVANVDFWTDALALKAMGIEQIGFVSNGQFRVDEIRLGDALLDIASVPEPGAVALLGLAGLPLLGRRRRNG